MIVAALGGTAVPIVAFHPQPLSGWALWALAPNVLGLVYLALYRVPPRKLRLRAVAPTVGGYGTAYAFAAGVGDESYTDIARLVYLELPALGICAVFACYVVVESVAAIRAWKVIRRRG
jgi:hypothetical protein